MTNTSARDKARAIATADALMSIFGFHRVTDEESNMATDAELTAACQAVHALNIQEAHAGKRVSLRDEINAALEAAQAVREDDAQGAEQWIEAHNKRNAWNGGA